MDLSAVFIVPIMYRLPGREKRFILLAVVLKPNVFVPVLQQEIQLTEYLGYVPAVDLVDDQEVLGIGLLARSLRGEHQRPVHSLKPGLPGVQRGTESLHKILVGVRRMELDQRHTFIRFCQSLR